MTNGSLVRFLLGFLGGIVTLVDFAKNLAELPHYSGYLVVCEGVLGPIALKEGAKLNLQELCSTAHYTCTQYVLGPRLIVKQTP